MPIQTIPPQPFPFDGDWQTVESEARHRLFYTLERSACSSSRLTRRDVDHHLWSLSEARTGFGAENSRSRLWVYTRPALDALAALGSRTIERDHLIERAVLRDYLLQHATDIDAANEATSIWLRNATLMCGVLSSEARIESSEPPLN